MVKSFFCKGFTLGIISVILFFNLSFASDESNITLQGKVFRISLEKRMMMVNEGLFFWNEKTIFTNPKGTSIAPETLKKDSWVYIEGEKNKSGKGIMIKKIYLLPKYINNKERNLYPFMQ